MAQVTAPVILDSTGQQIVTALQNLNNNVKPTADEIKRTSSNNQTVEAALTTLNSQIITNQLATSQGIPSTATSLSLNETYNNYLLVSIEIRQYNNVWATEIVPSAYIEGSTSSGRLQIRGFYSDCAVEVYKNTTTSLMIKSSGSVDLSPSQFHVVVTGIIKK